MEFRHLVTLRAIADAGSFTAAADDLLTVQSNVSEQIRQLEEELGAQLVVRSRRGATLTEFGAVVLERAVRIDRELAAMRVDLSMLQGLQQGSATLGVVGTSSRWLIPALVTELSARAPGVRLRVNEGASERLATEVLDGELAQAVVTEPIVDARLVTERLLDEDLVAIVPDSMILRSDPVELAELAEHRLILMPTGNPLRAEIDARAAVEGVELTVPIEVEGVRLIADLVAAGSGAAILPETAIPPEHAGLRTVPIAGMPPRRLALITARDTRLSLADQEVRRAVLQLILDRT